MRFVLLGTLTPLMVVLVRCLMKSSLKEWVDGYERLSEDDQCLTKSIQLSAEDGYETASHVSSLM